MNDRPQRRVRTATNSRLVVAVLVLTFFAMLAAIRFVVQSGKL